MACLSFTMMRKKNLKTFTASLDLLTCVGKKRQENTKQITRQKNKKTKKQKDKKTKNVKRHKDKKTDWVANMCGQWSDLFALEFCLSPHGMHMCPPSAPE